MHSKYLSLVIAIEKHLFFSRTQSHLTGCKGNYYYPYALQPLLQI